MPAFIPKQHNDLPDNYGLKIFFIDGHTEEHELASHSLNGGMFEFVTKDDIWNLVSVKSIKRMEFDRRFSKIVATKQKAHETNNQT